MKSVSFIKCIFLEFMLCLRKQKIVGQYMSLIILWQGIFYDTENIFNLISLRFLKKYVVCTKNKTCYIDIDIVLWNKSDLRYMLSYTMTTHHI